LIFENKEIIFFAGHLHYFVLATYMGYPPTAYHTRRIAAFGTNGQGVFYLLVTWAVV